MEINEEKRQKFMENAGKRVNNVMHDIQILEPMARSNSYDFTKEDVETFCDMYKIEYDADSHGNWAWINFKKDGKILDLDELRTLGVPKFEKDKKRPIESNLK